MKAIFVSVVLTCLMLVSDLTGQIRLPGVLSDHAVLQRERPARVWGWGQPGETIAIAVHHQFATVQADKDGC